MNKIPIEAIQEINQQYEIENAYILDKNARTYRKYLNTHSKLRIIFDKLNEMFTKNPYGFISYNKVAKSLSMKKSTVKIIINELAIWDGCLLIIVNTPKRKECFQLSSRDLIDTKRWIIRNQRYLASKEQRFRKTQNAYDIQKNKKEKIKEKKKIPIKQKVEKSRKKL